MNAIIYCRVSSKEQIEGTSLESQESACRDFARTKGLSVLDVFVEQGESAKFADRTQLLRLIDFCKEHKGSVDTLIVWKIDRFARNVADHYSIKTTLLKYGVRVVSVTEPIDSDPTGKLMEGVLASVAQFDNDVRAMRTVQGMRRRIQEGIHPWGTPLGYKSSVMRGEKKNLPDLADEPNFSLMRRGWGLFATGEYSQSEIAREMQTWGLGTPGGKRLAPQTIHQIFANPYYAGILVDPWDGSEHQGLHPAMVSEAEFMRVQAILGRRGKRGVRPKYSPEFPLRGFAKCDGCERTVTGGFSRGRSRRYPYYLCQADGCAKRYKSHAAKTVHDEFADLLDYVAPPQFILKRLEHDLLDALEKEQVADAAQRSVKKQRAKDLDAVLLETMNMRARNLISDEEFRAQRRAIVEQQAAIQGPGAKWHEISVAELQQRFAEIEEPLVKLRETWNRLEGPFRRRFERLILPTGFLIGNSRTAQMTDLFRTIRALAVGDSSVVPLTYNSSNQIIPDIIGLSDVLRGVEIEEPVKKWRFKQSHRARPPMRKLNPREKEWPLAA